jgi:hypothetical protein
VQEIVHEVVSVDYEETLSEQERLGIERKAQMKLFDVSFSLMPRY